MFLVSFLYFLQFKTNELSKEEKIEKIIEYKLKYLMMDKKFLINEIKEADKEIKVLIEKIIHLVYFLGDSEKIRNHNKMIEEFEFNREINGLKLKKNMRMNESYNQILKYLNEGLNFSDDKIQQAVEDYKHNVREFYNHTLSYYDRDFDIYELKEKILISNEQNSFNGYSVVLLDLVHLLGDLSIKLENTDYMEKIQSELCNVYELSKKFCLITENTKNNDN